MQKDELNVHVFQNRKWYGWRSDRWFWLSDDLFRGRILSEKNDATEIISQKTEVWKWNFTAWKVSVFAVFLVCIFLQSDWIRGAESVYKRGEGAISSYFLTDNFLQCILSVLMAKNHQKFHSRFLVYKFFITEKLFLMNTE